MCVGNVQRRLVLSSYTWYRLVVNFDITQTLCYDTRKCCKYPVKGQNRDSDSGQSSSRPIPILNLHIS